MTWQIFSAIANPTPRDTICCELLKLVRFA